jgi:glucose-1-phosphate cytidylyltransferase
VKTVVLCGGYGTRFSEETRLRPKPLIEIGGLPIVIHILSNYRAHGFKEFVLALGYKGECIKDYFVQYPYRQNDLTIDFGRSRTEIRNTRELDWIVHLVDTGIGTMTGGRLARLKEQLGNETFMVTYGDGVADVDINELLQFHRAHGRLATVTAVRPKGRFGIMECEQSKVVSFREKVIDEGQWINGGFLVFEPQVLDLIDGDSVELERDVLTRLSAMGQLMAYEHTGFWQCMDTQHERLELERLWEEGAAPWKLWKD